MTIARMLCAVAGAMLMVLFAMEVQAQNRGPFAAHPGLEVTTAFESGFGPDA